MSEDAQRVRVVVVSPGDVARERADVQGVVDELNRTIGVDRGLVLSLWRWETDAYPAMHLEGPQGVIDELMDIEHADLVIGVFWKRFGTPTSDAGSGTEHELRRAWAAWHARGHPQVMVYFCTRPYTPVSSQETAQWGRVLDFRRDLPREQLWWSYERPREFRDQMREHITRYLLAQDAALASPPPDARRRVRFNLPTVTASFTGRDDELNRLERALAAAKGVVITQAIGGLGGIGKSQLAAAYVRAHVEEYEIVAWVGAEDGAIADLAQLAARLGGGVDGLAPSDRAQLALEYLAECEQRWLLVLDNVTSAEQLAGLLPSSGNGRVLVTSRDRALRQFGAVLTLDVFDEDTATQYLIDGAQRPDDAAAARLVVQALGCLPLALSHAAAYCAAGTSFDAYLQLLEGLPAPELFDAHPEASYTRTVASTWKASIQAASDDAALAAEILAFAAYLAPDAIPRSLFGVLADGDGAGAHHRLNSALNALSRFNLATVSDTTVAVHRLLQKVIRDDATQRGEHSVALQALRALTAAFPEEPGQPESWPVSEGLIAHVFALAENLRDPGDAAAALVALVNQACLYLMWAEGGWRTLDASKRALAHADRVLAPEHPARLTALSYLGHASRAAGHAGDAIAILEQLLPIRERVQGAEHPATLSTRHNLAGAYQAAGRAGDAIAIFEQLLPISERVQGAEHPDTLTTRHNLAAAYREVGRTEDARRLDPGAPGVPVRTPFPQGVCRHGGQVPPAARRGNQPGKRRHSTGVSPRRASR